MRSQRHEEWRPFDVAQDVRGGGRMRGGRRGSLLIITLWIVTILGALAVAVARFLSVEIYVTKYRATREQAAALARGGVYLAMQRLAQDADGWAVETGDVADPGLWVIALEAGYGLEAPTQRIHVRITDEAGRVSLSQLADLDLFKAVSVLLGENEELAAKLVDAIDDDGLNVYQAPDGAFGVEFDDGMDPPYYAKNGPMGRHEELLDIPGMSAIVEDGTFATFRAHTSVHHDTATLNLNTVSPKVLIALGFDPGTADLIASCRAATSFDEASVTAVENCTGGTLNSKEIDLMDQFGIASDLFRVVSEGIIEDPPMRVRIEAIIDRSETPPRIVAWHQRAGS